VTILNTHLDHVSEDQRRYGASLLLVRGRYEAFTSSGSVFFMGDFNSSPTGVDSGAYKVITGQAPPLSIDESFRKKYNTGSADGDAKDLSNFKFLDIREETPRFGVSANFATFTGWSPTITALWVRIDFVFGGSNGGWKSTSYHVGAGMSDDGMMHSDHRPVFVDLVV